MSDNQKADQIAFHFYTKLFNVVNHARTTSALPTKLDKWFNLEVPDSDLFTKDAREPYRSISSTAQPAPLVIQVLLTVPELATNQVLVHISPDSSRTRIDPTPGYILLEEFVLDFIPACSQSDVPPPTIYKHGIPLFRSLFTLLRLLPTWKLHKRLRRRIGGGNSLGMTVRVREGNDPDVLSLMSNSQAETHTFPSVPHPLGSLALTVTYLTEPTFQLDELESLLSSRFLSLDQRPFTPTLAKNRSLRDSLSSTSSPPSSRSPPRVSTSSSSGPHSHSSSGVPLPLPDRGPRPPPPRNVTSLTRPLTSSTSQQQQQLPLSGLSSTRAQLLRQQEQATPATASSSASFSPSNSFTSPAPGGASTSAEAAALTNIITTGISTSASAPATATTAAGAGTSSPSTPARRLQPQYPFPFKSNTLVPSSGPSSPSTNLAGGGGIPSSFGSGSSIPSSISDRIGLHTVGDRERVNSLPQGGGGLGLGLGLTIHGQDPVTSASGSRAGVASPSPGPAAVSSGLGMSRHSRGGSMSRAPSLRERSTSRPPGGAGETAGEVGGVGASGTSVPRKRYSSSFGHRYGVSASGAAAAGGGTPGSVGSTGAAAGGEDGRERRVSGVFTALGGPPHASPRSPHPHSPLSPSPSSSTTSFSRMPAQPHPRHADDDDLSMLIQDIDKRKPLIGRSRTESSQPPSLSSSPSKPSGFEGRSPLASGAGGTTGGTGTGSPSKSPRMGERQLASAYVPVTPASNRLSPRLRTIPLSPLSSETQIHNNLAQAQAAGGQASEMPGSQPIAISPPGGRVLTSEAEIDERLRRLNEAFLKSLEGLGSGGGGGGGGAGTGAGSSSSSSRPLTRTGSPNLGPGPLTSGVRLGPGHARDRSLNEGTSSPLGLAGRRESGLGLVTSGGSGGSPFGGAPVPLPPSFRRQGSQEVIGTLDMEGDDEPEEAATTARGAYDYEMARSRGRNGGSRFTF